MVAKDYKRTSKPAVAAKPVTLSKEEQEQQINEFFDSENQSLESKARELLPEHMFVSLKKIAYLIAKVGLSVEESCILVDIDPEQFKHAMIALPIIKKIITIKILHYKKDLLSVVSARARNGDDKLALALLEKRYPDEFGRSKSSGTEDQTDLLGQALDFIRKNGDAKPMVEKSSGASVVAARNSAKDGKIERSGDLFVGDTISPRFGV